MPIKVNGTTSGSVTLAAPATGSDVTLTLPTTALATESFVSSSYLPIAGGKILQIVRATDSTQRSTNSTSFVDVTGMSVTISPTKNDSAIVLLALGSVHIRWTTETVFQYGEFAITDSSNNTIGGAQQMRFGLARGTTGDTREWYSNLALFGYSTPATTSATTYKLRFKSSDANITTYLQNSSSTGQMYAIEVSA